MKGRWFANLVLVSGALLLLAGAVMVSPLGESSKSFTARDWAFVAGLAAAAGLFLLSLRLPLGARIAVAVTLLSVALGTYALEAALRWQITFRVRGAAHRLGYSYDPRMRLEVLQDLRRSGADAWPLVFPGDLLDRKETPPLFPLGGISNVTTVHCNEMGPYLIYHSDEHGFHNPPGLWGRPGLEVALVGDSFAQGNCVGSEQNAAARIRSDFPSTLNLGMEGNGPLIELAGVKEFLSDLKPRRVVWLYCAANDLLFDLPHEKADPFLTQYLESDFRQNLADRQGEVDAFLKNRVAELMKEQTMLRRKSQATWDNLQGWLRLRILRHTVGLRLNARKPDPSTDFELLQRVLQSARDAVEAWGGKLYFVYLPSEDVFLDSDFARQNEPERRRIFAILQSLHVPVIDLQPVLGNQNDLDSLYAIPGAHLSPRGYELMGKTIADVLKADKP